MTLAEVTTSLAASAILLGAMTSTVMVASKALPERNEGVDAMARSTSAIDRLSEELQTGINFVERSSRAVEFTIPDRNDDAVHETVRYEWSGLAGDPLLRQYNGGSLTPITGPLDALALVYDVEERTSTQETTTYVDSGETTIASFTSFPLTYTATNHTISNTNWAAELFTTVDILPIDATQLRITRVVANLRRASGASLSAYVTVGIHPANQLTGQVTATPIGTPSIKLLSTMSTGYLPQTFNFSDVVISNPLQGLAVVFKGSATTTAQLSGQNSLLGLVNTTTAMWTNNAGTSWQPALSLLGNNEIPFTVYGMYRTRVTSRVDVTTYHLKNVRAAWKPSGSGASPIVTSVHVLNQPDVGSP